MTTSNEHNNAPAVPRVEVCCLKFDTCRNQCVPLVDHLRGQIKELKAAPAVPQGWRDFLTELSKQKPEKPDYWSSCGQCERNSSTAEDLLAATPDPVPAQDEPFGYFRAEPFGWTDCAKDDEGAIALYERPQEVGLTGPAVAWRMRDTGFRRPKYVYFDTKEQAVAHAAHLLQSRDDGHLTELTPLCEASTSTDLLDALRDNSWKLEPFEIPTGQGDADIGWRVVGFYMGKPKERTEATVYTDDPAAAIIAALRAKGASDERP